MSDKLIIRAREIEIENLLGLVEELNSRIVKHTALLEQVEELAAALRYVSMPITKPYESLTVDGLLEIIKNDDDRARQALASYEAWKKECG